MSLSKSACLIRIGLYKYLDVIVTDIISLLIRPNKSFVRGPFWTAHAVLLVFNKALRYEVP